MSTKKTRHGKHGKDTSIVHSASRPEENYGILNPPVYHASTIVYPTLAAMEAAAETPLQGVYYGRHGTPTSFALEEAVAELEGGEAAIALPSGLAAISVAMFGLLKAGDHALVADSVYDPTRKLCDHYLARFGVETTYYDPLIGAGISELIRPETKLVFTEAPGSLTFEMQDIPAIAKSAHDRDVLVLMDNTWSGGLYFQPFEHGVDVSIQAATKYIGGHADVMLGMITTRADLRARIKTAAVRMGYSAAPDDAYLGLRGLRTLSVRLARHHESGLALARWFEARAEVASVLHPALPSFPGHDIWRRDFTGASGLFGVVLKDYSKGQLAAMLDGMEIFAMGYSWGGYESLMIPTYPETARSVTEWKAPGPCLRIHAGLEDVEDLIADLEKGFERLATE